MSNLMKNIIRFFGFILVQVFILDRIPPLHQFVIPQVYYLFILWLPFKIPRLSLTLVGFLFGLTLDYFTQNMGLHAAACTLVAYVRPLMINLLMPKETSEFSYAEPSGTSMGWLPYSVYVLVLTLLHHIYLVTLEWLQFGNFWYFVGKVIATTAVSFVLVMITELLFYRKARYRTNVA
jgi:rod shape-determining protein MreD